MRVVCFGDESGGMSRNYPTPLRKCFDFLGNSAWALSGPNALFKAGPQCKPLEGPRTCLRVQRAFCTDAPHAAARTHLTSVIPSVAVWACTPFMVELCLRGTGVWVCPGRFSFFVFFSVRPRRSRFPLWPQSRSRFILCKNWGGVGYGPELR